MNKLYTTIAIVLLGTGLVFADAADQMKTALTTITGLFCTVLPLVMMVAFMLAALVYAAGQMTSADQRARFHGWATSLLIGAVTAGVVYIIAPWIINTVFKVSTGTAGCT
jgi:hypothetical protein